MEIKAFSTKYAGSLGLNQAKSLEELEIYFDSIRKGIQAKEPLSMILGSWLYENICCEAVRTRLTTARVFEDFIADAMGGVVSDTQSRKNLAVNLPEPVSDKFLHDYIVSNKREKADVVFSGNFVITVKTTVPSNNEINMGSFAREALFRGFLKPSEYGGERRSGLGSKPQMTAKLKLIQDAGKWPEFSKRFLLMAKNIFSDDLIYFEKADNRAEIYFLKAEQLYGIFKEKIVGGPASLTSIVNRYEGNSIRIDNKLIKERAKHISIDLTGAISDTFDEKKSKIVEVDGLLYGIIAGIEENTESNREKIIGLIDEIIKRSNS